MKPTRRARSTWLILLGAAAACGESSARTGGAWQATHDTIGDTVVVHTTSGSVWDTPMELVEELAIGAFDGPDEYTFGSIGELLPDGLGGVYVFDDQATSLRQYDASGAYVRTIGRSGGGPGEYRGALDLERTRDGRLVLYDGNNARIVVYDADAAPLAHLQVAARLFAPNALVVDTAGDYWVAAMTGELDIARPLPVGYLHLDSAGAVLDTLFPPAVAGEPERMRWFFTPHKEWLLLPDRSIVAGVTDRYAIELRRADGSVLRIERDAEPVAVLPGERAEIEAINEWYRHADMIRIDIPPVPDVKPIWSAIMATDRGELWVRRHTTAEQTDEPADGPQPPGPPPRTWIEPGEFDVFDRDGRYLGVVRPPRRTEVLAFRDGAVWGVRTGEFDEPYVVRMRLRPAGAADDAE